MNIIEYVLFGGVGQVLKACFGVGVVFITVYSLCQLLFYVKQMTK